MTRLGTTGDAWDAAFLIPNGSASVGPPKKVVFRPTGGQNDGQSAGIFFEYVVSLCKDTKIEKWKILKILKI